MHATARRGDNPTIEATISAAIAAIRRATPELVTFQSRRQAFVFGAASPWEDTQDWAHDYQESTGRMRFDVTEVRLPQSGPRLKAMVKKALEGHPALSDSYTIRGPRMPAAPAVAPPSPEAVPTDPTPPSSPGDFDFERELETEREIELEMLSD